AGDEAFIDGITQVYGQEWPGAHVAHAVKAGFQSLAGISDAGNCAHEGRIFELINLFTAIGARSQMSVAINQAGENGGFGEISNLSIGWNLKLRGRTHTCDALILNHDDHVFAHGVAGAIEEAAGANVASAGGLGSASLAERLLSRLRRGSFALLRRALGE